MNANRREKYLVVSPPRCCARVVVLDSALQLRQASLPRIDDGEAGSLRGQCVLQG
jgi:hypothetical protein